MRSTRSVVTWCPVSSVTSLYSHCQICERAISAVAASSIRLKMPTAAVPCSQEARYWIATLTLLRRPASVTEPGVDLTSSSSAAVVPTSSRSLFSWFGWSPNTASKASRHVWTMPGCATQEPVSYTHLRAHETDSYLVCRLLLEKKKKTK